MPLLQKLFKDVGKGPVSIPAFVDQVLHDGMDGEAAREFVNSVDFERFVWEVKTKLWFSFGSLS